MPKHILRAKNPHNQYIIDNMYNLKMKCLRTGQDKVAFIYQKIIYSLQKYPMPLLCEEQVSMLQGVGEKTSILIIKMIKEQYSDYEVNQKDFEEAILEDHLGIIDENIEYQSCPLTFNEQFKEIKQSIPNNQKRRDNFKDCFVTELQKHMKEEPRETKEHKDQQLNCIKESKNKKIYNPGKDSKNGQILLGMFKFQELENKIFASKKQIKDYCRETSGLEITKWNMIDTLEKHELVQKTVLDNEIKYALTAQGIKFGDLFSKEHQLESKQNGDNNKIKQTEIILLIDNRERFQNNCRQIIYDKLTTIYKVNCRLAQLPIGDFMWIAKMGEQEFILDYIIERKTISDLASSILDKRYAQQKHRLKTCGINNLFYLIEYTQSSNLPLPRQTLEKAIRNTQIRDGFFIKQTNSLEDSLQWITTFTKKLEYPKELIKYTDFLYKNSSKCESLYNLWGSMLRGITGVGLQSAKQITDFCKTPIEFYEEINKDQSKSLQQIMQNKQRQVPFNVLQIVETLFQSEIYPNN